MGARLAAEAQQELNKELVKGLVSIQLSFSIFESPCIRKIFNQIAPHFQWPHWRMIATTATQLYYEFKQKLMDKAGRLPNGTPLCASVNRWTTKDQAQSCFAIVLQWIDRMSYVFHKTLVAFEVSTTIFMRGEVIVK
ncbi:hypothetical protein O181_120983 [Austropuccinia psidii MF-1]|uniref:Uncharacterized protein n=1 Tax=Austropuccinia psidii MF-1 TaxID=1389203 RepID=A0A9Q3Q0V3_9BASI|nr:hypothetical protein [Austropuccinia psidii MF-1]